MASPLPPNKRMTQSRKQNVHLPFLSSQKARNTGLKAVTGLGYAERKHLWLDSRGGRTEADVLEDEQGEYVLMGAYGKKVKVYIPKDIKVRRNSNYRVLVNSGWGDK